MLKIGIATILVLTIGLFWLAHYYGLLSKVNIAEEEIGPFHIVYEELEGIDTAEIRRIKTDVVHKLASNGITPQAPFDVYYPEDSGEPNKIGFEIAADDLEKLGEDAELKSHRIERGRFITTYFPFRSSVSFLFNYLKVDPAFRNHRREKGYADAYAASRFEGDRIYCLQPIIPLQ